MQSDKIVIPTQSRLEERFIFIQDETLRTNIVITFRYIIFLIELEQKNSLPGPIIYSIYKDMIVQTGTVVESCVHYLLKRLIEEGRVKSSEVMGEEWKEEKCSIIEKFEKGKKEVCGIVRHKLSVKLTKHTSFIALNRACLHGKIFSQDVFDKAEKLRESRNKIHLAGLANINNFYTKDEVDRHFEYAQVVLKCIEEKLSL
jgi:hypothetical protein